MQINGIDIQFSGDPRGAQLRCLAYLDYLARESAAAAVGAVPAEPP